MTVSAFVKHHYRHFNAATLVDAAEAWKALLDRDGRMFLTLAGAMSTAELGLSLAEMIRRDKVHAISCTGANLEEDVFNLVAHDHYQRIPNWRNLRPADEKALERAGLNRVTDTCIPEDKAFRAIEKHVLDLWVRADQQKKRYFPHEIMYQLLLEGRVRDSYQIDPAGSWLLAAAEKNLPIFVPGWEDSTLGNMYAAHCLRGDVKHTGTVRTGVEYMMALADWYRQTAPRTPIGFFQIGGGIAGDFPICVVPMLEQARIWMINPTAPPITSVVSGPVHGLLIPSLVYVGVCVLGAWYLLRLLYKVFFGPLKEPAHENSFIRDARRGVVKHDDLLEKVRVRRLRAQVAAAGLRVVREELHVTGTIRRLPGALGRWLRDSRLTQDALISNIEYVLATQG
jgi:deoxyhypusine synthase